MAAKIFTFMCLGASGQTVTYMFLNGDNRTIPFKVQLYIKRGRRLPYELKGTYMFLTGEKK